MPRYWMFTADRETVGPFDIDEIRRKAAEGVLLPDTQVCPEGSQSWVAAAEVPDIAAVIAPEATPRVAPPTADQDRVRGDRSPTTAVPEDLIPTLTFLEGFRKSLRGYGKFRGRSRRSEFW